MDSLTKVDNNPPDPSAGQGEPPAKNMESTQVTTDKALDADGLKALSHQAKKHLSAPNADSFEFFRALVAKVTAWSGDGLADIRIECLSDASKYFYLAGHPFLGIEAAQATVRLAREVKALFPLRRALSSLGAIQADTGNLPLAIESCAEALAVAQEIGDRRGEAAVWNNLGSALCWSAQYDDGIMCLERVVELSAFDPTLQTTKVKSLTNIAAAKFHLEDYRGALQALNAASASAGEPKSVEDYVDVAIRNLHATTTFLALDNMQKAREHSLVARRAAAQAAIPRADICACIAEGLYEVHAGMTDIGLSRLTNALEKARLVRGMLRDTLIALVKAYEAVGQPDRALVYLRELLDSTRKGSQEYALAYQRLHLQNLAGLHEAQSAGPLPAFQRREAVLRGKLAEQELLRSRLEMLERLAVAAELRDDSTGEHSYRVGKLSALLAQAYGCDEDTVFMLDLAGRLHDIGKIGVPDAILLKPGRLNSAEIQVMRAHTTVGAELLAKSNVAQMQMAEEIARFHHEWWDGTGYPTNLSGTAIPLVARITALADVFDALTHKRPYKEAWPIEDALAEIASLSGRQFDPELCTLFLKLIGELQTQHGDLDAFLGEAARGSSFLQARSKIWAALAHSRSADPLAIPGQRGFSLD